MAKLVTLLIGFVLFSLFVTVIFKYTGDMGNEFNTEDAQKYAELSGEYDRISNVSTNDNSFIRKAISVSSLGVISGDSVDGALEGGKILLGSFDTMERVSNQVESDVTVDGLGFLSAAVKGIFVIILGLSILFFFWRAKAET